MLPVAPALAEYKLNFQEPVTAIAREQYELHTLILWIIIAIAVAVFGVMIYSIIVHRKSAGYKAATFHENTTVELAWTIIPFFIIMAMAFPATRVILDAKDAGNADLTVKVVGYQWKWSYDYLDDNVFFYSSLATPPEQIGTLLYKPVGDAAAAAPVERGENYLLEVDKHMVVPVNQKVRLLLTAADVNHAWWVPQLGVKQDAIPGIVREAWFEAEREGVYRGACAELCGRNHGFMPIVVEVVSADAYADWVAQNSAGEAAAKDGPVAVGDVAAAPAAADLPAEWNMETLMAHGQGVYETNCGACHQANGEGLPPTFPTLVDAPSIADGAAAHIDIVLNGVEGTAMASFAYLSDADLAAIITYERNAWGNDTGDVVLPEDIAAVR